MISRLCGSVTERRLRPIYEYLDNGNNKKAMHEAEKVLKKQPELHCAKVLKCLALLRLNRETECLDLLDSIKYKCPVDESTLQLMTVCYRDINKPNLICEIYENAFKFEPGNEDILNNLFISYVRIGDYIKQNATAVKLYKLKPKNQYNFWCIISSLLQSVERVSDLLDVFTEPIYSPHICAKDRPYAYNYLADKAIVEDNSKLVNVKVAERRVEKLFTEHKLENEQELLIYMILLDMLDKHEKALEILDSNDSSLLENTTLINLKLAFLAKLGKWSTLNILVKQEIEEGNLEGWNYFLYYIDSIYELSRENPIYFQEAQDFLNSIVSSNTKMKKRGPSLARLELCSRFSKYDTLDYLVEYFKDFGTKEVCVHDLKPYLHHLSTENCSEFLRLIWEPMKNVKSTRARMDYHICHEEFTRVMDCKMSDRRIYIAELMQCFIDALEFNEGLPNTEMRSSDRYALLALLTLYDLYIETNNTNHIIEAITICHYALCKSPSNSQFKLLLLKFGHLVGGSEFAHCAFINLDVKHMQLDTLGYLHVFPLISTASYGHATTVMAGTLKFFNTNKRESTDHITYAYKYDAYTKIPEMIAIKEKQNNSIHFRLIEVERMLMLIFRAESYESTLLLIKDFNIVPQYDHIPWELLEDNRDFKVLWDLEPKSRSLTNEEIQISRNMDITYLNLRSLLLRIIIASVNFGSTKLEMNSDEDNGGSFAGAKNILINLVKSLEEDVEKIKNNLPKACVKKPSVAAPPKSRLPLMNSQNYFDFVLNGLYFLLSLMPGPQGVDEGECKYRLGTIMMLYEQFAPSFTIRTTYLSQREEMIKVCSLFVEFASVFCIIIGVSDSIISKMKTVLTKKNKKKKETNQKLDLPTELDWRAKMLNKFIIYASDMIKNVDAILKSEEAMLSNDIHKYGDFELYNNLKKQKDESYLINHIQWTELESMSKGVNDNIIDSHKSSVNNMSTVLKSKLKYLNSFKI